MSSPMLRRTLLALFLAAPAVTAQDATTKPAEAAAPIAQEDPVLVTCDGRTIKESEVEFRFLEFIQERTGGRGVPPEQLNQMRPNLHAQIVEEMINETLLGKEAKAKGVTVTDAQCMEFLQRSLDRQLKQSGMRREDLAARIEASEGISLEEFMGKRSKEAGFRRSVLHIELVKKQYPEKSKVTPEEVQGRYERDKASTYTKQEEVTASHILIGTEEAKTEEAKAEKRATAERVLALCRAEGADFAALAKEHSTGPSGPMGGSLGSFPRNGVMVEPFAKAAFELQKGEVSGLVETQFGFHIIKVTDRQEGRVVPFEEVRGQVRDDLFFEKIDTLRNEFIAQLRGKASIVYPEKG